FWAPVHVSALARLRLSVSGLLVVPAPLTLRVELAAPVTSLPTTPSTSAVSTSAVHMTLPVDALSPDTLSVPVHASVGPPGRYAPVWLWSDRAIVFAVPEPAKLALNWLAPDSCSPAPAE